MEEEQGAPPRKSSRILDRTAIAQEGILELTTFLERRFHNAEWSYLNKSALLLIAQFPAGEISHSEIQLPPYYFSSNPSYILNTVLVSKGFLSMGKKGDLDKRFVFYALTERGIQLQREILDALDDAPLRSKFFRDV